MSPSKTGKEANPTSHTVSSSASVVNVNRVDQRIFGIFSSERRAFCFVLEIRWKNPCREADWLYHLCLCFPSWVYLLVDFFLTVLVLSSCVSHSFKMLNQAVKKLKWFGTFSHDLNFQHLTFRLSQSPKRRLVVVLEFGIRLLQRIVKAFQDFMFTDIEIFWKRVSVSGFNPFSCWQLLPWSY